ncbi:MAG TPA: tonB-system energizer ExbB [Hansschlegelia sp.]
MRRSAAALLAVALLGAAPVYAQAPAQEPAAQSLPPAQEAPAAEPGQTPPPAAPAAAASETLPAVDASRLPHDLSPVGMFLAADWIVKGVMIGLAFASLVTWTVLLAKALELAAVNRRVAQGMKALVAARTLDDARRALDGRKGAVPAFVAAADAELAYSGDALSPEGVKERVASHLSRLEAQAGRKLAIGTGLLATIGSTAPFVGLFGTVWGIMNSFIGISNAQTTNLAVVAPGIAEALLATAIGLVAAIPAVVIYNVFARAISGHRGALADASAAVLRLVSRDLDRMATPRLSAAAE